MHDQIHRVDGQRLTVLVPSVEQKDDKEGAPGGRGPARDWLPLAVPDGSEVIDHGCDSRETSPSAKVTPVYVPGQWLRFRRGKPRLQPRAGESTAPLLF